MNQLSTRTKNEAMFDIGKNIEALLNKNVKALPKNFNQTRFLQNCLTVLNDTKEIEKCSPVSVARTMIKGAYLGLDFFRRECYAIPYGNELNFQTDWKGEVKLVKKYSIEPIIDIYAKVVREGDSFQMVVREGKQVVNFTPKEFNDGQIIGTFAVACFKNGAVLCEPMSRAEIEEIRKKFSKAPNSPAWEKAYGEMCKKVVLRRLCKSIQLEFDCSEQDQAYEEGADSVIDAEATVSVVSNDTVKDPFKPDNHLPKVDSDAELTNQIKKEFPNYEDWQISAVFKERKGQ